jgi:hypothetical protein
MLRIFLRDRIRSVEHVVAEIAQATRLCPPLVGNESDSQATSRRALASSAPRQFTRDAKALGIAIHGTMGLPGRDARHHRGDHPFRTKLSTLTRRGSRWRRQTPAPRRVLENGWRDDRDLYASRETFYCRFHFRPRKPFARAAGMVRDPVVSRRRLEEGTAFPRVHARGDRD